MKTLTITLILAFGFTMFAQAQRTTTATMTITATVVSGATSSNSQLINIDLRNDIMTGGTFTFRAPDATDTQITVADQLVLRNEKGETITYDSDTLHEVFGNTHILELLTSPVPNQDRPTSGMFRGEFIASVNYL